MSRGGIDFIGFSGYWGRIMQFDMPVRIDTLEFTPQGLEALLEALDMRNTELAKLAGVDVSTVQRWLSGRTPLSHSTVRMLAYRLVLERLNAVMKVPGAQAA